MSHFLGCGKKTAWSAWENTPGLTDTLVALSNDPSLFNLESDHMQRLERFVVLMYSKTCGVDRINEARYRLFTTGKKTLDNIPPTQAALVEHIKRALLQACSSGARPHLRIKKYLISVNGDGTETAMVLGYHTGPPLRTAARPVLSCCTVGVQSRAQETASAVELGCVVQARPNVKVAA